MAGYSFLINLVLSNGMANHFIKLERQTIPFKAGVPFIISCRPIVFTANLYGRPQVHFNSSRIFKSTKMAYHR